MTWFAYRRLLRSSVIVNLKTGESFRGVLIRRRGPLLFLANATFSEGSGIVSVDGEVIIERSNVRFIQLITVTQVLDDTPAD